MQDGYDFNIGENGDLQDTAVHGEYKNGTNETTSDSENKKTEKKRFPLAFTAVILVLCIIVGGVSGAVGAFFMYKFVLPDTDTSSEDESVYMAQNSFSETASEEENTFMPDFPATETESDTSSNIPIEETTGSANSIMPTKGEIYASQVNSIVSIKAVHNETYSSIFGSYSQPVTSKGTGFVITDDGYIITNYHVIDGGETITVTDYNGNEYSAVLAGGEKSNDVAVLKTDAVLPPVELGNSSELKVGDDILIIGNALGELTYTVTDGIISHLSRSVKVEGGNTINMFQTNTAINSGNSGGPVYNEKGEVVGIASAKYASESVEGLGFCIPIDDVKQIISDIIIYGYVSGKPSLDVSLQTVTSSMSLRYSLPVGCYIVTLDSQGAAALSGLKSGDVITKIGDTAVGECADVETVLASYSAKDTAVITYYRNSSYHTANVTFSEKVPKDSRTQYSNVFDY